VKNEPPGGPAPVGVPAGELGCVPGCETAEKLKDGALLMAGAGAGVVALLLPKENG
jgi:hypothetical protein